METANKIATLVIIIVAILVFHVIQDANLVHHRKNLLAIVA
jgi:hypothetical protein